MRREKYNMNIIIQACSVAPMQTTETWMAPLAEPVALAAPATPAALAAPA